MAEIYNRHTVEEAARTAGLKVDTYQPGAVILYRFFPADTRPDYHSGSHIGTGKGSREAMQFLWGYHAAQLAGRKP